MRALMATFNSLSFAEAFNHAAKAEMAAVVATPDAVFRTGHQAIGELGHVCSSDSEAA